MLVWVDIVSLLLTSKELMWISAFLLWPDIWMSRHMQFVIGFNRTQTFPFMAIFQKRKQNVKRFLEWSIKRFAIVNVFACRPLKKKKNTHTHTHFVPNGFNIVFPVDTLLVVSSLSNSSQMWSFFVAGADLLCKRQHALRQKLQAFWVVCKWKL